MEAPLVLTSLRFTIMALGDVLLFKDPTFGSMGSTTRQVQSGAAATINAGEFVLKTLGSQYVVAWGNTSAKPVVATDFLAGMSASTSTDTASAAGVVDIVQLIPGQQFLVNPDVAATFGQGSTQVQSTYNALVGDRVLLKSGSTGGAQTLLAVDGATNGFVVEDLDIQKYPGKVAISARAGLSYLT